MTYDNSIKKIAELYDARITSTKDAVKAAGQGYFWEFVWFQNLSPTKQRLLLPYVKFRKLHAKNPKFAGKWKSIHNEISPKLIKEFFSDFDVQQTNAAAFTVKKQQLGSKYKGNRRADFLIKFRGKII